MRLKSERIKIMQKENENTEIMTNRSSSERRSETSMLTSDTEIRMSPAYLAESLLTREYSLQQGITSPLEQDLISDLMKTTAISSAIDTAILGYPAMLRITNRRSSLKLELIDFEDWSKLKPDVTEPKTTDE